MGSARDMMKKGEAGYKGSIQGKVEGELNLSGRRTTMKV